MSVRPILLKDIRRTAINSHQQHTGKGNYNRFAPLERNRTFSSGKRQLSASDGAELVSVKTPKLDSNLIFEQLKDQDAIFAEAKILLDTAIKSGEDSFSATDGGIGTSISCLTKLLALVLKSQENLTSAIIDSAKLSNATSTAVPVAKVPANLQVPNAFRDRSNSNRPPPVILSAEEVAAKKVKHVIREAEKKTLVFNLDLGTAPTMNKETLSRKVTLALSNKCSAGNHDYHIGDAEEVLDDLLSCSKLEFLGSSSKKYLNNNNDKDPLNGKMCTMPVRFDFKDRETRIQAEISLRKICQVRCSTPYPKKLRQLLNNLVTEGKKGVPDKTFIRTRVNVDKLCVDVHARLGDGWKDLGMTTKIPLDILDSAFSGFHNNLTAEQMDEDVIVS